MGDKMYTHWDIFIRLLVATVFGIVIGFEREIRKKPLGLKTTLVISIVSCLLTIVSIEATYSFPYSEEIRTDPLRLAAQIIAGVGFIGAGVIMKRGIDTVSGLTTSAMIWGASGLGVAVGANFILEAFFGLILIIFSVEIIPWMISLKGPKRLKEKEIFVSFELEEPDLLEQLLQSLNTMGLELRQISLHENHSGSLNIRTKMIINQEMKTTELFELLKSFDTIGLIQIDKFI
ncbi:MAG: MgtC/SapB transporter [Bacillales bacterium]|jgi:putative Mg2+ transporter-C (MgtC) family protein|nr:MgtC/SapB transporter [Bacillales bacterium]